MKKLSHAEKQRCEAEEARRKKNQKKPPAPLRKYGADPFTMSYAAFKTTYAPTAYKVTEHGNVTFSMAGVTEERIDEWSSSLAAYQSEREKRNAAIFRLWQYAVNAVEFRYPDPAVTVTVTVTPDGSGVYIALDTLNVMDNTNPERRSRTFTTGTFVDGWPGHRAAIVYLVGLWSETLRHEALESALVKNRRDLPYKYDREIPGTGLRNRWVVDPHGYWSGTRSRAVRAGSVEQVIREVLQTHVADELLASEKIDAAYELQNEINPWIPGC